MLGNQPHLRLVPYLCYFELLISLGEQAIFTTDLFPNGDKMYLPCSPPLHSVDYLRNSPFSQ